MISLQQKSYAAKVNYQDIYLRRLGLERVHISRLQILDQLCKLEEVELLIAVLVVVGNHLYTKGVRNSACERSIESRQRCGLKVGTSEEVRYVTRYTLHYFFVA